MPLVGYVLKQCEKSELFNPARRVAVPVMTSRTLPIVRLGFEAARGAAITAQRFGRVLKGLFNHFLVWIARKLLGYQPAGSSHQRGIALQMGNVVVRPRMIPILDAILLFQPDQRFDQVDRRHFFL